MSLKSGFKSISGSAGRGAAKRVLLGESVESEEEVDDVDSSSEDGGVAGGSQEGSDQDDEGSDEDAGLALSADPGTFAFNPLPLDDDLFEMDGADDFTPMATIGGSTPYVKTRSRESRRVDRKVADSKVSSKLDFSDDTLQRLVKALKPAEKKKLQRSLLPKLSYSKQIMVSQATFAAWVEQIKVYTYSRRWPAWCTCVGGLITWDGVDDDEDNSVARREAYEWMETSIPENSKYILIFVKKGDAKGVYEALWKRFASLTVKELQQRFWSLEMRDNQQVDKFAHLVHSASVNLEHAGAPVSDQQLANVYVLGLSKYYAFIKEKYRNLKVYSFVEAVDDATNFAIANKLMNVHTPSSTGAHVPKSSSSVLTAAPSGTMCKYWRMKKGCFKAEKCPLAQYHTPETKGKGWNAVATVVPTVIQAVVPKSRFKKEERKCYTCNKVGHLRQNCPMKNDQSKNRAQENQRNNANAINNLSLNFMMMSPVTANLFTSFNLKSEWILDSGATEHICSSADWVTNGTLYTLIAPTQLTVGNGQVLQAAKAGTVHFNDVSLSGVLVCEQCPVNIISEGKLLEKGLTISKSALKGCLIMQGKNVIMTARIQNKLMFVDKAVQSSNLVDVRRIR